VLIRSFLRQMIDWLGKLEREEANAISDLRSVEAERGELAKQLDALDAEERELAAEEAQ
jgi:hypothetical protein